MSTFAERFKELRLENNRTQKELATFLAKSDAIISKYETGKAVPEFNFLIQLADYFNVSIDYLVGRSDEKTISKNLEVQRKLNNLLKFASGLNSKKIEVELKNNPKYFWTETEVISLLSYLDILGFKIPRILDSVKKQKKENNIITFDSLTDEFVFVMEEMAEIAYDSTQRIKEIENELNTTTKNKDGFTEYRL